MSLVSRLLNVFRASRLSREIDEEYQSHFAEALAEGRDPAEARRALGPVFLHREESRDLRLIPWLESLRADFVFGWRQLIKKKVTSAAAVLSLALAIGSCTTAFRLIDALLWRPLPVTAPERLYALSRQGIGPDGSVVTGDGCAYPMFRQMRVLVKNEADLIAISSAGRTDIAYGQERETEKAYRQYVSGWMFESFGISPALGRVFTESDDKTPGAHPYAVLSRDYWKRRFAEDPAVIGKTFRAGNTIYQIVGVAAGPFTGTEPGRVTDIFVPTMMMENNAIVRSDYRWFRTFVHLKPGAKLSLVHAKLSVSFRAFLEESVKMFAGIPKQERDGYLSQKLLLNPASAGVSGVQREYGTSLFVFGVLVILVLLISCANVANLMTAQAAAREREMALRVSIGAGRSRLVQLIVAECAWLAALATALGGCFAWWISPMLVGAIGEPGNPVRLLLPADARMLAFSACMALAVTMLFGLTPALRASRVKPADALKGGNARRRPRTMRLLIAAQVTFCVLVLFVAGLFVTTAVRLTHQVTGFSADRLLLLETLTPQPQTASSWELAAARLRTTAGVEAVAISEWPLMTGESWSGFISTNGIPPGPVASYFLTVSPEWRALMKIKLLSGRDLRLTDASPGAALVNQSFARQYMRTENPVGRQFEVVSNEGRRVAYQIVGLVADARYRDLREPMQPAAYFPFKASYHRATFIVRTFAQNPLALVSTLRSVVQSAGPGFRVSNISTQKALVDQGTIRERLLAALALFFGAVALALAGIGVYGVLDYSVLQRRKEIGIRMAIGARGGDIAQNVLAEIFTVVLAGLVLGVGLGLGSARFIRSLLFDVKPAAFDSFVWPVCTLLCAVFLASLPAVIRAIRTDPVAMLRSE